MRFTRQTNIGLIIFGILFMPVSVVAFLFLIDPLIPSEARQDLPASATHIHEKYDYSFNLQGDYQRIITARMPEKDVALFAKRRGLEIQSDGTYLATPRPDIRYTIEYDHGTMRYEEFEW